MDYRMKREYLKIIFGVIMQKMKSILQNILQEVFFS